MSGRLGDGGCATGRVALPWTIVSAQNPGPGFDHVPIAEACVARGQSTMRGGSRTFSAMQCLGRLGPGLPERADRQLARLLQRGLRRLSDAGGRTGCNGTNPHERGFAIRHPDADHGLLGAHGRRIDRAAVPLRGIEFRLRSHRSPRCLRRWFPLADEHLRRTCPISRGVRQLRPADLRELSPVRWNTAR